MLYAIKTRIDEKMRSLNFITSVGQAPDHSLAGIIALKRLTTTNTESK